jgi:hypothetical protein
MSDELLTRLRRLEDREAIHDLHNQYCFIQDRGHSSHAEEDVRAFLELCDSGIVWDNSHDGSRAHRGQEAVAVYLRRLWRRFESCMHFVHNLSIVPAGDRASTPPATWVAKHSSRPATTRTSMFAPLGDGSSPCTARCRSSSSP